MIFYFVALFYIKDETYSLICFMGIDVRRKKRLTFRDIQPLHFKGVTGPSPASEIISA